MQLGQLVVLYFGFSTSLWEKVHEGGKPAKNPDKEHEFMRSSSHVILVICFYLKVHWQSCVAVVLTRLSVEAEPRVSFEP